MPLPAKVTTTTAKTPTSPPRKSRPRHRKEEEDLRALERARSRSKSIERLLEESKRRRNRVSAARNSPDPDSRTKSLLDSSSSSSHKHNRRPSWKTTTAPTTGDGDDNSTADAEALATIRRGGRRVRPSQSRKSQPPAGDDDRKDGRDELLEAMEEVVRAVLSSSACPEPVVNRASCSDALREYERTRLELKRVSDELSAVKNRERVRACTTTATTAARRVGVADHLSEERLGELERMLDELEAMYLARQEEHRRTLREREIDFINRWDAREGEIMDQQQEQQNQMQEHRAQERELRKELEKLKQQNLAYEQEIRQLKEESKTNDSSRNVQRSTVEDDDHDIFGAAAADSVDDDIFGAAAAATDSADGFEDEWGKSNDGDRSGEASGSGGDDIVGLASITGEAVGAASSPVSRSRNNAEIDESAMEQFESMKEQLGDAELKLQQQGRRADQSLQVLREALQMSELKSNQLEEELRETLLRYEDVEMKVELLESFIVDDRHMDATRGDASSTGHSELQKKLAVAQTLASQAEQDRRYLKAALAELSDLAEVCGESEAQQLLYEKSLQCAELSAAQEALKEELEESKERLEQLLASSSSTITTAGTTVGSSSATGSHSRSNVFSRRGF